MRDYLKGQMWDLLLLPLLNKQNYPRKFIVCQLFLIVIFSWWLLCENNAIWLNAWHFKELFLIFHLVNQFLEFLYNIIIIITNCSIILQFLIFFSNRTRNMTTSKWEYRPGNQSRIKLIFEQIAKIYQPEFGRGGTEQLDTVETSLGSCIVKSEGSNGICCHTSIWCLGRACCWLFLPLGISWRMLDTGHCLFLHSRLAWVRWKEGDMLKSSRMFHLLFFFDTGNYWHLLCVLCLSCWRFCLLGRQPEREEKEDAMSQGTFTSSQTTLARKRSGITCYLDNVTCEEN